MVRRLLDDNGIDPAQISGTGLGGRITRADVLGLHRPTARRGVPLRPVRRRAHCPPAVAPLRPRCHTEHRRHVDGAAPTAGTDEIIPFTNIRRRTAEHMVRSKATSAHTLVVLEADYEQVERVRRSHGAQFRAEEGFALTYLPFVARATSRRCTNGPHLNASVGDDSLIVHHQVNLGIAVDLDHNGLIVPVVQRAEELTLRGMARRIRELADRARTKKLSADDISGGTFSITNAGPFGHLPHVADHQPAPGGHPVHRRGEAASDRRGPATTAPRPSPSTRSGCCAWRGTTGPWTGRTRRHSSRASPELLATHDWAAEL